MALSSTPARAASKPSALGRGLQSPGEAAGGGECPAWEGLQGQRRGLPPAGGPQIKGGEAFLLQPRLPLPH